MPSRKRIGLALIAVGGAAWLFGGWTEGAYGVAGILIVAGFVLYYRQKVAGKNLMSAGAKIGSAVLKGLRKEASSMADDLERSREEADKSRRGRLAREACLRCGGAGEIYPGEFALMPSECPTCRGRGWYR